MLEVIKFESTKKGKNLLVLGAIHGNEICGPIAIRKVMSKIKNSKIGIDSGSVTFIPICNPRGYMENKRFIDMNLNRTIKKIDNPKNYEEYLAQIIARHIDQCDYLLDVHSMPTDGPVFAFLDKQTDDFKKFIDVQNFQYSMVGWNEIFGGEDNSTVGYAIRKNKIGTTIECGNHNDKKCIPIAENAILNSMAYLGISDNKLKPNRKKTKYILMEKVFIKEKNGKLLKYYNHLDKISKDEVLATYDDGEKIIADNDCLIILPHNGDVGIGLEWFYLGKFIY